MDLQNPESKWSYRRMACTENFVIFWEKGFGNDLSNPPQLEGHDMKVDLPNLMGKLESFTVSSVIHWSFRVPVPSATSIA